MRRLRFETIYDKDYIDIEDSMLKLWKSSKTYKDFGKLFYKVSTDAFHNYTMIFISLSGKEVPNLHLTLAGSYIKI